jgi:cytochrome c553
LKSEPFSDFSETSKTQMKKTAIIITGILMASLGLLRAGDAKENWEKTCTKCHGADGKGETKMGQKVGVKDLTDAKAQAAKDEEFFKAIKEGVKDGDKIRMKPAEGLTDDEMKALVAYVRALKK